MIPAGHHLRRLSEGGDRNLGLCCSKDGLYLGRTPLIERSGGTYAVRPSADLERLFGRAYGGEAVATRVMGEARTFGSFPVAQKQPLSCSII